MKRIGVILFTLLFVGALIFVPCLADGVVDYGLSNPSDFNTDLGTTGLDAKIIYTSFDEVSSFAYNSNSNLFTSSPFQGVSHLTIRFINSSDNDYEVTMGELWGSGYSCSYSNNQFIIPSHGYFDLVVYRDISLDSWNGVALISTIISVDYSYSVFNASGIIGTVGNVFGMIFNSSTILLPLFLIGITVSLGLVAIRYIRKVMWSR